MKHNRLQLIQQRPEQIAESAQLETAIKRNLGGGLGMSSDWPVVTLQDITTILGDGLHGTPKYDQLGDYYFINGNNLNNGRIVITDKTKRASRKEYEKYKKEFNDRTILVSINGTLGNIAFYNGEKVFPGKSACYFNVKQTVDKHFVRYMLESRVFQNYIHNLATGSTIKNVSLKLMREFSFKLPPVKIQTSISSILKSLDEKIQLNQNINQTLEKMAQAIFKSWFVDFEPVKAKTAALEAGGSEDDALLAAMQAIAGSALFATDAADADAPTQLARLQAEHPEQYATLRATAELFPSAMQESELGEIPEGWATKEIKALSTKISKGSTPRKADIQNAEDPETIELLKVRDLSDDGEITRVGLDKIPKSVHCGALKRSILETDDILFSIAGTIGRVAVIEKDLSNSNCNQAVAFIRLAEPFKYLELCRLNLVGSRAQNEVVSKVVQGVQANFSLASLGEISIVIPSDELLYDFNYMVIKLSKKRKELMTEVRVLAELRDALLPKLLSGELSLAAAEEQLTDTVEPAHV